MSIKFKYKARNQSGKLVTGKVETENRNKAINLLRDRKFFVVDIQEASYADININFDKIYQKKVNTRELAVMCRQFATMIQAGVPILQSLNILTQQCDNKTLRTTMRKVTEDLGGGISLAESFKAFPAVFPPFLVSMVEAGEVGGSLDQVLDRLAVNFEKEHELKEKVKSAMTYPLVVMVIAVLAVAALMIFVVPKFVAMLTDMKAAVPLITQIIINISEFMKNYWYVFPVVIAAVFVGYKQALKTKKGKILKDRVVLKFPIFGPMLRKVIVSRFCRTLSTLLKSGVPLLQAFDVVKNVVGNDVVVKGIRAAESSIKDGHSISLPLQETGIFPPMVTRMMLIGEETGSIDNLLERIADYYEQEVEYLVSRLSSTIEPVLIVGMGVLVGFIILSIMLPMFSVIENVK